ncbi:hypothetical protein QL285_034338 [Trifolium repens]|nr:hypothetical protein QL285_034338 [Trifolium repens]
MAARSSNKIVQEPFNPTLPPIIDLNSKDNLVYEHHQTDAGPDAYDFFTEKFVDFESLKANGIDIQYLFYNQQWQNYFEMLNGFVYYDIVKYFWQKAKVYDRASADKEYKDKIKGRGANTVQELFEVVEKLNAPRLTSFNHEEECQRLAFLAAVNESITRSLDDEQARIAAEMERQRLAEQEAFKLLVDRAVHIAVIETNKILENQGAAEDTVMNDQNLSEPDSDKGKAPIVASSPPRSPPVLVQGSSSSAIPSVMQEALDVIKHDLREELRNEMDEFRADIREDMNRSGEATNKKIDAMMELLLKLTQQQPKP